MAHPPVPLKSRGGGKRRNADREELRQARRVEGLLGWAHGAACAEGLQRELPSAQEPSDSSPTRIKHSSPKVRFSNPQIEGERQFVSQADDERQRRP